MTFQLFNRTKRQSRGLKRQPKIDARGTFAYLNEQNADVYETSVEDDGIVYIEEEINGSWRNETIEINQRERYRGHRMCIYRTEINAGAGKDTIIINHENLNDGTFNWPEWGTGRQFQSRVEVRGGAGIDTFIEKNSYREMVGLRIMDMQVGEKFITNSAHSNAEELVRRSNSWSTWTVRSDDYRGAVAGGHLLYLSPGTMLEKLFNAEGDAVYMCVPENG